tara:strand:- start:158 stop:460 length:303 start_codon:yes stop_codon:yes gene_type:complete
MKMETKLIRLISGEELIAKTEPTDGGITIQDAVILIPTKAGSLGLTNWMPYVEVSEILNSSIVFVGIPHPDLVKQYDSVISGIVVPDNEIKTPADLKLTT